MQWEQICLHNEKVTLHNEVTQLLSSTHHGSVSSGRLTVENSLLNHILPELEDWATTRKKCFHHTYMLNTAPDVNVSGLNPCLISLCI